MALTEAEKKKMVRIEKELEERQKALETMKEKASNNFVKYAMKYDLWKLDNKTTESELKAIAEKHKTI